jgi:hypothetical protein
VIKGEPIAGFPVYSLSETKGGLCATSSLAKYRGKGKWVRPLAVLGRFDSAAWWAATPAIIVCLLLLPASKAANVPGSQLGGTT